MSEKGNLQILLLRIYEFWGKENENGTNHRGKKVHGNENEDVLMKNNILKLQISSKISTKFLIFWKFVQIFKKKIRI